MDERRLTLLRRKLEALSYSEPLDPASAPLVQKLVDDLVRTTETYRALKLQSSSQSNDIAALSNQLEVVKQESSRLTQESNELHVQIVQQSEKYDLSQKEGYQQIKRLEDKVAELTFWQRQAQEPQVVLERENAALKQRINELVKLGEKRSKGEYEPRDESMRLVMTRTIGTVPGKTTSSPTKATVTAQQVADNRIAALQLQVLEKEQQLGQMTQVIEQLQAQVSARDQEIQRLGALISEKPPGVVVSLEQRQDAKDGVILALNQQVDYLNGEVSGLEQQVKEKDKIAAMLAESERGRMELDTKLQIALRENSSIQQELGKLRHDLLKQHSKHAKAGAAVGGEVEATMKQVTEVSQKLAESRNEQAALKEQLQQMEKQRSEALSSVADLNKELEEVRFVMDEAQAERDHLEQKLKALEALQGEADQQLCDQSRQLEEAQKEVKRLTEALEERTALLEQATAETQEADRRVVELSHNLAVAEGGADHQQQSALALQHQVARLESELRCGQKNTEAAEAETEALRVQLKEAHEAKLRASVSLQTSQDEKAKLLKERDMLSSQLKELQEHCEELTLARDNLQLESSRLRTKVTVLEGEKDLLQQQLEVSSSELKEGRQRLFSTKKELGQLQSLQMRVDSLQEQCQKYLKQLAEGEAEQSRLQSEVTRLSDSLHRNELYVEELLRTLDESQLARDEQQQNLHQAEEAVDRVTATMKALEVERDRALLDRQAVQSELDALREALEQQSAITEQSDGLVHDLQVKLANQERNLTAKVEELDRLQSLLCTADQTALAARQREEEARAQSREYAERARRAEVLYDEHEEEMARLRANIEGCQMKAKEGEATISRLQQELEARKCDIEQLTTLSLRGDATVQEYMTNLKTMASELRSAELKLADLEARLVQREDTLHAKEEELAEARKLIQTLDHERDMLQNELDHKAEEAMQLAEDLEMGHKHSDETNRLLAAAEARLNHANERIQENESELGNLKGQLQTANRMLQGLAGQHEALKEEYRGMAEDLEALVKENQVVSNELATTAHQRESLSNDLRRTQTRLAQTDQSVRAKEAELEDIRRAYEGLAMDHMRLKSTLAQMERESVTRESQLQSKCDEVQSLQEAQRAAQGQINQYMVDLQALERQLDCLSSQLNRGETEAEDLVKERDVLLEELRAAQQVRFALERAREELQRQLAALDGQLHLQRVRLQDAEAEKKSLQQRLQVDRSRVSELESLLATMRAREFKSELSSHKSGGQLGLLQEKNLELEEQVKALQDQLRILQQMKKGAPLSKADSLLWSVHESMTPTSTGDDAQQWSLLSDQKSSSRSGGGELLPLGATDEQISQLRAQLTALEKDNTRLKAELRTLEGAHTVLRKGLDENGRPRSSPSPAVSSVTRQDSISRSGGRAVDLELKEEELKKMQERLREQEGQLLSAKKELALLKSERENLVDLLARTDAEKTELQRKLEGLQREVDQIKKNGGAVVDPGLNEDVTLSLKKLQTQYKEEQRRRRQAESDFHELMESIDKFNIEGSSAVGARRLKDLQTQVGRLEGEKQQLEQNLSQTRITVMRLQSECLQLRALTNQPAAGSTQRMSEGIGSTGRSAFHTQQRPSTTSSSFQRNNMY